ncbi:hypothetical protein V5P93_000448 [Actinokineospora auranticolor]|uniref:Uncharacterized protein n=1 Tax=Actinokineospora auranticolor TaxID=155976 RepID=A0A2S6GE34_9PSEU|nr:hypothetical protein [Actinokineospora auranticolor]PPK63498.1 hypothetical protein CLV40_12725 [Actinokineospora auranticolor]
MARDHARIQCDIWDDDDFRPLSTLAKLLYIHLLSQKKLTYAGLLDLAAKRWARAHPDHDVSEIRAALSELAAARMIVIDHDTEEVLIRTLIRNDGIAKQPQVLAAALRQAYAIESPILRAALAVELRRLPVEVCGSLPPIVADSLERGDSAPPVEIKPARRRPPQTAESAAAHDQVDQDATDTGDPAGNPSGKGSARPLGVGGGGKGETSRLTSRSASGRTRATRPDRQLAERLVAEHVPAQPRRVTARLNTEAAALLAEGIGPDRVGAGLRRWSQRRVGAGLLPELVGEAMRTAAPPGAAGTAPLLAALELARRVAHEDQDDSELGRILRTADDDTAVAALLSLGVAA